MTPSLLFFICSSFVLHGQAQHAQKKIDDDAFPVRLLIVVLHRGFSFEMEQHIDRWLDERVGRTGYAFHSAGSFVRGCGRKDRIALYLQHPQVASDLLSEFSSLELADGTLFTTYTTPKSRI